MFWFFCGRKDSRLRCGSGHAGQQPLRHMINSPSGHTWNQILTPYSLLTPIKVHSHLPLFQNDLPSPARESLFIFLGNKASRSLPNINSLTASVTWGISCSYSQQCWGRQILNGTWFSSSTIVFKYVLVYHSFHLPVTIWVEACQHPLVQILYIPCCRMGSTVFSSIFGNKPGWVQIA